MCGDVTASVKDATDQHTDMSTVVKLQLYFPSCRDHDVSLWT